MEKDGNNLIKEIIEIKNENEHLEELINFLKMENFDYAMKCNHLENVLANIDSIVKNCPGKLLEASDNVCNTLQLTAGFSKVNEKTNVDKTNETVKESNSKQCSQSLHKTPLHGNKAHVVKPHMVNGHVLYTPTINLTRVSNLQTSNKTNITPKDDQASAMVTLSDNNDSDITQPSSSNQFNENATQLSTIEEISEPSSSSAKSPSHSTVLSGTFQEVKIYLNQVSPNSFNEDSRKSMRKSQIDSSVQSKSKSGRSKSSFKSVTKRKRN